MQEHLKKILDAGIAAADPGDAVRRSMSVEGDVIVSGGRRFEAGRVFVLAAGKAAGAMAGAAEELLGDRVRGGLIVAKKGGEADSEKLEVIFAAHPEPDELGVQGARKAQELAASLGEGDLLLSLISGGASALLADPAPPVELADLKKLTQDLLMSGATIEEINTVRKYVSVLKGGGLARLSAPAGVLALLLSDVVGDEPSSIASGPAAPDTTTLQEAKDVLGRYNIHPPENIAKHLESVGENPKPGDGIFDNVANVVCGGGRHAVEAATEKARKLGYEPLVLSTTVTGEARASASVYAAIVREILATGRPVSPPCAIISGGEATVTVRGDGTGGPNQEFALALAVELAGVENWAALSADTDGNDGSTKAAGGTVDGRTAAAISEAGVDPAEALDKNDAHATLRAGDALLVTGPTGTNVNDLRVVLVSG